MANEQNNVSKEEQIGFHKGCLSTLAKEREELSKMINNVEQILNAHIEALKELGVDIQQQSQQQSQEQNQSQESSKPKKDIEDII
ncbi:MAG: hypothetical protein ACQER9_01480 [Nanobdellota archaeon]